MLRVFGNVLSPFARKVYLALDYKGVDYESVDVVPHAQNPEFVAASPLGLVPALEHAGATVADSSVICDYLEQVFPQRPLYPSEPAARAQALWIEEYSDTRLRELLLNGLLRERVANPVVRGIPTDEERVRQIIEVGLPPELDYLDSELRSVGSLENRPVNIGDISLGTCFISADAAGFAVDEGRWPALHVHLHEFKEMPFVASRLEAEAAYLEGLERR